LPDNELNDEELIEILKSSDEPIVIESLDDVHEFVLAFNIKEVEEKSHVRCKDIYNLYKKWRAQSMYIQYYNIFFKKFSKHFQKCHNRKYVYYNLDPKPFDLTNEESKYNLEEAIKNKRKRNANGKEID